MLPPIKTLPICRTCLSDNDNLASIYDMELLEEGEVKISDIIILCASVQVNKHYAAPGKIWPNKPDYSREDNGKKEDRKKNNVMVKKPENVISEQDGLPKQMCMHCIGELKRAFVFRRLCEKSDFTLRNSLASRLNTEIDIKSEVMLEDSTISQPKEAVNVKVEPSNDMLFEFSDCTESNVNQDQTDSNRGSDHDFTNANTLGYNEFITGNECKHLISQIKTAQTANELYNCHQCGVIFETLCSYEMHMRDEHKSIKCLQCDKRYTNILQLVKESLNKS